MLYYPYLLSIENTMELSKGQNAARNFFLFFLGFALLSTVAFNFGGILFDFINKNFPLVGSTSGYFSQSAVRFHLASLIIGTPIFLWLQWKLFRESTTNEVVKKSAIRRWLTYITLVIAALIVIGDLISLVFNLLGGETSTRFILKTVVVLIIAAAIFYYYLMDVKAMHDDTVGNGTIGKAYLMATAICIVASIVGAFTLIESPLTQKQRNEDVARLNNLQQIESSIYQYYSINTALPDSLAQIQTQEGATVDPVTKEPFEYRTTGAGTFELCATFSTSNRAADAENFYGPDWLHDAGHTCFPRNLANQFQPIPKGAPLTVPAQ